MPDDALPVVIYAAKSSPDPRDSVASQIDQVRDRVEATGGRSISHEPFSEENVSGYRRSRGPQLDAAIAAAKEAAAEHGEAELWVFHSSRLARGSGKMREARALGEVFYDLRRHGVTLRSVEDDAYVTDEAFVGMASKMANKYSEDLAAHVRRGKRQQFERGQRLGGPVPDGYRLVDDIEEGQVVRRYVFDPNRAQVIRTIAALALDGLGDPAIARRLNRDGHRTRRGKPWTRRRVQDALTNPFYAGRVVIHRGTPRQQVRPGAWPPLIGLDDFDRLQAMRAGRDRPRKNHAARTGRRTIRYALARLGRCDRCGERMYCVTSPYKRKDGTQQRSYVCANVRNETGLCDQPKLDAAKIDAAVVAHLDRLFIDFDAWLEQLAKGAADHRAGLQAELSAQLEQLAKRERQEAAVQRRLAELIESGEPTRDAVESTLRMVLGEKATHQQRVEELREALAAEPDEPPTDAMLDIYNAMARAVRGGGTDESVADLNDRLRAVFEEFRLDRVDTGVVGVLPILRRDFIDRYRESGRGSVMADYEDAIPTTNLPEASPTVLWATEPPPVKPLRVPSETGRNAHSYLLMKPKRWAFASSQPYAAGGPRSSSVP
jgi:DNA invertase Pin-like site-specific DNA recombinase